MTTNPELSEPVNEFLSRFVSHFSGYDGLAAATIQTAFKDCYAVKDERQPKGKLIRTASNIRLEAAVWLLSDGRYWADMLGIQRQKFSEIIELLMPPQLKQDACHVLDAMILDDGFVTE
jgi:hypothetical protein